MSNYRMSDRFRFITWISFLFLFSIFFLPAFFGLAASGEYRLRTFWVIFSAAFFGLALPAILCRHCPHYADRGRFIVCPSTVGPPKLLRSTSAPVSGLEKVIFAAGFALILGFPVLVMILRGRYLFALLTSLGAVAFLFFEMRFSCSRCLNFSCLLNRVPAEAKAEWQAKQNARDLCCSSSAGACRSCE